MCQPSNRTGLLHVQRAGTYVNNILLEFSFDTIPLTIVVMSDVEKISGVTEIYSKMYVDDPK